MKRSNSRFAVLGYLGLGPASPYELVRLMQSGTIHRVWPRAESKVYEEPKRLVDDGLACARNDGGRRTVYEITDAGQRWLAEQLDKPEGTLTLEFEAALKVLFADHGTREQLLASVQAIRDARLADVEAAQRRIQKYVESTTRPERTHLTALVAELIMRLDEAVLDWADWAEDRIAAWDGLEPNAQRSAEAATTMRNILNRSTRRLRRPKRESG